MMARELRGHGVGRWLAAGFAAATFGFAEQARAEDPQAFVLREQEKIGKLIKLPISPTRDAQLVATLAALVDYEELTRRTFGKHWLLLSEAHRGEARDLMKQLIELVFKNNAERTLDYEVIVKSSRATENGDARVRTEAKSKTRPREPALLIDYVVRDARDANGLRIVDIVTEGSSLTKNYHEQFHRMMMTPGQGFPLIAQRLRFRVRMQTAPPAPAPRAQ